MAFKLEKICFGCSNWCFVMGQSCQIMSKCRCCLYLLCYILYIFGILFIYIEFNYDIPGPFVVWIIFSGLSIMFGGIGILDSCGVKLISSPPPRNIIDNPLENLVDHLESHRVIIDRIPEGQVVDITQEVILGTIVT